MRFELTADQQMIEDQIKHFMRVEILPSVADWDQDGLFEEDALQTIAELGMLGVNILEEFDGGEADVITLIRVLTEMAVVDASLATMTAIQNAFVVPHLMLCGDVKEEILPAIATGEAWATWVGPSSDFDDDESHYGLNLLSDEKGFYLDGSIPYLPMAETAQWFIGFAKTKEGDWRSFWVENDSNIIKKPRTSSLGLRGVGGAEVQFSKVRLSSAQCPERKGGWSEQLKSIWRRGRIALAAVSLGIARAALEEAIEYSKQRRQFGKPLAAFQAIQWKIANVAMQIDATRLTLDKAADAWQKSDEVELEHYGRMARFMAAELAIKSAQEAIQIHGGYGYTKEFPVERFYRDAQTLQAQWGGSDLERNNLAKDWFQSKI